MGMHGVGGIQSSGNGRACTLPTLNFCNKNGGTSGVARGALDGYTSSKGHRQHQGSLTQQSNRLRERVAPVDDGQGSFI